MPRSHPRGWTHGRGSELLSPDDLLAACHLLERLGLPLRMHRFESGVVVVRDEARGAEWAGERLAQLAPAAGKAGLGEGEVALRLGVSPALALEQLLAAELAGLLCRDEAPEGLRFFRNAFFA